MHDLTGRMLFYRKRHPEILRTHLELIMDVECVSVFVGVDDWVVPGHQMRELEQSKHERTVDEHQSYQATDGSAQGLPSV